MANIKSAIKRVRQTNKRYEQNSQEKAAMRTAIRKAEAAIENNEENANELVNRAFKLVDTAAGKGLIHKNSAARQKSRLAKKAN
ncbi:MAG TPA: 30S ribosomal protein S20 [Sporosarcina sp.]|nr:30S ribosomal protein S20 [Sporosarcina sp.]